MSVCERCGKEFEPEQAAEQFAREVGDVDYKDIKGCLCADCAYTAFDDQEDGLFFGTCTKCGARFDFFKAKTHFGSFVDSYTGDSSVDYMDICYKGLLCPDCVVEAYQKIVKEESEEGIEPYEAGEI